MKTCITGHRPDRLGLDYSHISRKKLEIFAKQIVGHLKPSRLITGMAQGWDQACAVAAIELDIPFECAIPFTTQASYWTEEAKNYYKWITSKSERIHIISQSPNKKSFLDRNIFMVDWADSLLALFDGKEYAGTWHAVNYAIKSNKSVTNVWKEWIGTRNVHSR